MRPSGTREEIDRRGSVGATDGGVNSMTTLRCPRCGGTDVRRARRHGALERLLSALYIYPFRCQHCQRRFRRLEWGVRYRIGLDRRIDERLRVRGRADLRWEGGHAAGTVRDVSVMGAGIETETAIPHSADSRAPGGSRPGEDHDRRGRNTVGPGPPARGPVPPHRDGRAVPPAAARLHPAGALRRPRV
jgi:hypothetical protein